MIKIVTEVKTKSKTLKITLIVTGSIIGTVLLIWAIILLINKINLDAALKNLNIKDEQTVIQVMKYGKDKKEIVKDLALEYKEAGMYRQSARLCLYSLQYLKDDSVKAILKESLTKSGADNLFISQFEKGNFTLSEFTPVTEYQNEGYGVSDGIYVSFLGGYAKAKISSSIALEIYAFKDGAYYLDSTDRMIKKISIDGSRTEVVSYDRAEEFVYFEDEIYYIKTDGTVVCPNPPAFAEGEVAANLRISGGEVVCTVYDKDYNSIRDITLK